MGRIRRYKNSVERFLSGEKGQRFFNFAYSVGAAVVILGALFKILHLPGGNMLLTIGMGTEVLMFMLTAFDRPPKEYNWEEVFPVLASSDPSDRPEFNGGGIQGGVQSGTVQGGSGVQGGVIITGNVSIPSDYSSVSSDQVYIPTGDASQDYMNEMSGIAEQMHKLKETTEALNKVSETLLESYRAITENSENITQSSIGYVEQMQNLNRNISGLNTIYEIQLKSVASQLDAIDQVNKGIKDISKMYENTAGASTRYCEESEKMAMHMAQLNQVYAKMLNAMTINMYATGAAAVAAAPAPATPQQPAAETEAKV